MTEFPVGFPLHQMKNGKEFRDQVVAPPGYDLVEFDAAGQEFRWMAIASGDPVMLKLCLPGEDPHSFMTSNITGDDYQQFMIRVAAEEAVAKNIRKLGKVANLSLQYRTSPPKLRSVARLPPYSIPMELAQAQHIHKVYYRTYAQVSRYQERQIALTRRLGYVETMAGRRVKVIGNWARDSWQMGSTAINYRIQGTGGDQRYLALAVIEPTMHKYGIIFAWDMHDGIYMYCPKQYTMQAIREIKHALDNLPYKRAWGLDPPVPLPFDAKMGPSWGSLKPVEV